MSKKKIIAIVSIIVLLFAAGISVGVFLYGRGESAAVDGSQVQGTTDQNQPGDGNQPIEGTPADGNVQDGENGGNTEANPNEGDDNTQTPGEGNADGEEDNENVENNNQNANNNAANNNNQAAGNDDNEVTTDTNVNNVGETTITRVEEQERLVSEAFWDWWMPMDVTLTRSNVNVNLPQITVEKRALTPVAGNDFVYAGQEITYVIDVTNNSDVDVEEIEITDKIPENTTFVSMEDIIISEEESVKGTTVTSENEVVGVKWIATIPAKETVSAYFTVKVNDEVTGTISNVAIANGEESKDPTNTPEEGTETKTAIITSNKSSVITRNDEEVQTAKIGDLITYTIQVTNTGDKEGITYITDEIPEGTKFVSVEDETAIFDEQENIVVWSLTVKPGETVEKRFTVEVTEINGEIENIAYIGEVPTNPDVTDTTGITVNKEVVDVKRNGQSIIDDTTTLENVEVKDGDVIEYTITVKNIGSKDLENVNVTESLNVDITKGKLNIGNLADGEEVVIEVSYTVTYNTDIYENDARLINNKVEVRGTTVTDPENEDEKPEDVKDEDETKTDVEEFPKIEVEKTATAVKVLGTEEFETIVIDPETNEMNIKVRPGDIIEYTILVKNTGNTTLENIKVTDSLNVTVDGVEKDLEEQEDGTMASVIAEILSLSAKAGENVETIKTYYTVVESDVIEEKPIHNAVKVTVPEGPENSNEEDVPVNPDTTVSGTKTWIDGGKEHNNANEIALTLTRTANGKTETVEATPVWNGSTYTYSNLEKYDAEGYEYTYSVSEEQVSGYDVPVQSGNNFTNTITDLNDVEVEGNKIWIDGEKAHNNAEEITLTLTRTANGKTETVNVIPTWTGNTYKFTNLERYDAEGYEYKYSVTETQVDGYNVPTYKEYDITNTITDLGDVEIEGTKTWIDGGKEHNNANEITLTLTRTANGKTETVEARPVWEGNTYKFSNLERYDEEGYEYSYTVTEGKVEGYDTTSVKTEKGINFTNTIIDAGDKTITGTKTWVDGGKTHNNANEITLTLTRTANGKTEIVSVRPTWNGNTYTFSKLEYYDAEGYEYTYSVTETQVSGYDEPVQSGNNFTNTITDPSNVTVSGTKTWIDDGRTHNNEKEITVTLTRTANGKTETVNVTPTWNGNTYTFSGLEKYDVQGFEYSYTVTEGKVGGYEPTVSVDGRHFTNTIIDPEDVQISGEKIWVDPTGALHDSITLQVYQNGDPYTIKNDKGEDVPYGINLDNKTTSFSIGDLPKYKVDSEGNYILKDGKVQLNEYTVVETSGQSGYKVSYSDATIDANGNYKQNVINTIENTEISIKVNKVWVDEGVSANRPSITVKLYMNDTANAYKTATIANNASSCTFSNLPQYTFGTDANGNPTCIENAYRVEEVAVTGYVTNNGELDKTTAPWTQTITNTVDPTTKTSVTVNKVWNAPNITEHPDITINLYKNGDETTPFRTTTLSAGVDNVWQASELQYTFNDLPKYKVDGEGKHILDGNGNVQLNTYTVKEIELPTYKTTYNGNTITNTAKGILQVTSVTTTATEHTVPADVVFVLDISGSMCKQNTAGNSRAKDMVAALNSAISTVMNNNSNSKVAVVTFSTRAVYNGYSWNNYNNATTILPLGTYTPKNGSTQYLTCSQGSWDEDDEAYTNVSISTNVQGVDTTTVQVSGGTYTQSGIAMGANILVNNTQKTYDPDGASGPIQPVTRTPILLLLSDGEPTVYTTSADNVGQVQYGNGSSTTVNEAYYTIKTAVEYKKDIENSAYGTANFYTIGFGADTLLLRTILNPNKANIDECGTKGNNNTAKQLYNKLSQTTEGIYGYNYADGSYTTGSITADELATLLNKFINLSQPQNSYRIFTADELTNKRIDLVNIDVEETSEIEEFISYGTTSYTFEQAKATGVEIVVEVTAADGAKTYYVDLSKINTTEQINIKYQTLPVEAE